MYLQPMTNPVILQSDNNRYYHTLDALIFSPDSLDWQNKQQWVIFNSGINAEARITSQGQIAALKLPWRSSLLCYFGACLLVFSEARSIEHIWGRWNQDSDIFIVFHRTEMLQKQSQQIWRWKPQYTKYFIFPPTVKLH